MQFFFVFLAKQPAKRKVRALKSVTLANSQAPIVRMKHAETESAAENKPPMADLSAQVRVKRRGKSSPRCWRQQWQGKPREEQGK